MQFVIYRALYVTEDNYKVNIATLPKTLARMSIKEKSNHQIKHFGNTTTALSSVIIDIYKRVYK